MVVAPADDDNGYSNGLALASRASQNVLPTTRRRHAKKIGSQYLHYLPPPGPEIRKTGPF
jgi:hypothetical protein